MSHFDQIDRDHLVRQIHSALFEYVQSTGPARDQGRVDELVKGLRSAYLAASWRAAKRHLQRVVRDGSDCPPNCRDGTNCG